MIQIQGLEKSFGSMRVLTGLDLEIPDNAVTTILGPSGTGKSVLLKHLVALLEPDAGEILVDGRQVTTLEGDELYEHRKSFGVLFQDGALFGSMDIFDNVAFPLRRHTKLAEDQIADIVHTRLREVGLGNAQHKAPGELSGGMRKRAGFARALILNPKYVLFDEPDSGLDPVRTSLLCDLILEEHEKGGGTYILVTHDIKTARKVSDHVGLLWKGKRVAWGTTDEMFENDDPFVNQFLAGDSAGPLGMD